MSSPTAPTTSHTASPRCRSIFDLDGKRSRLAELDRLTADPELWDDPRRAASLTQEAARLREEIGAWESLTRRAGDTRELASLLDAEPDEAMSTDLMADLAALEREAASREVDLLYSDPYADHAALVGVHAGAGGTDSQD